jgi:hypothetical protein
MGLQYPGHLPHEGEQRNAYTILAEKPFVYIQSVKLIATSQTTGFQIPTRSRHCYVYNDSDTLQLAYPVDTEVCPLAMRPEREAGFPFTCSIQQFFLAWPLGTFAKSSFNLNY